MTKRANWKTRALAATHDPRNGKPSQFGAILDCVLDSEAQQVFNNMLASGDDDDGFFPVSRPYFTGRAQVTSDGYVMCDFVTRYGILKYGAFVGSMSDLCGNVDRIAEHLKLTAKQRAELNSAVLAWCR